MAVLPVTHLHCSAAWLTECRVATCDGPGHEIYQLAMRFGCARVTARAKHAHAAHCRLTQSWVPGVQVLLTGARTATLLQRLPFLPAADAYVAENGGRIFYPDQTLPTAMPLMEDSKWRKVHNSAGGDPSIVSAIIVCIGCDTVSEFVEERLRDW